MPDANKFAKLREMGYTIPITCGLCRFGQFPSLRSDWGTCIKNQYTHRKHTGEDRDVSICRMGTCPQAEKDTMVLANLGSHQEFVA